jgi:hypothetical protein
MRSTGGLEFVCSTLTAQAGTLAQVQVTNLTGATRVTVDLDVPNSGGNVNLTVSQANGTNFQDQVTTDTRFVFDDAP